MHEDMNLVCQALDAGARGYIVKRAAESELVNAVLLAACGGVYVDAGLRAEALRAGMALPFPPDGPEPAGAPQPAAAVPDAISGRPPAPAEKVEGLGPAEQQLLVLLAQGFVMSRISQALGQDAATTERMRKALQARLGLRGRVDVMRFVRERGLLTD